MATWAPHSCHQDWKGPNTAIVCHSTLANVSMWDSAFFQHSLTFYLSYFHYYPWIPAWGHFHIAKNIICNNDASSLTLWKANLLEKTLMLGKIEGKRRRQQRMRYLDGITDSMDMNLGKVREMVRDSQTQLSNWTTTRSTWTYKDKTDPHLPFTPGLNMVSMLTSFPQALFICVCPLLHVKRGGPKLPPLLCNQLR